MMRRKPAKLPPVHTHVERIDDSAEAALAYCYRIGRRRFYDQTIGRKIIRPVLYGLSLFVLVDRPKTRAFACSIAADRMRQALELRGNQLPYLGLCADLPGWADYE